MNKEEIEKKARDSPLWLLEMRVSKQNKLLLELKGQGMNSDDNVWIRLTLKRNIYRKELIEKLKAWDKGETKGSNPDYSDYIDTLKYREMFQSELKIFENATNNTTAN